jgi:hypothetical protein
MHHEAHAFAAKWACDFFAMWREEIASLVLLSSPDQLFSPAFLETNEFVYV